MDRAAAKVIIVVIGLLMLLLLGISAIIGSKVMAFLTILFGLIIIAAVWSPFMLCPNCGRYLPKGNWYYTQCPHCGEFLND